MIRAARWLSISLLLMFSVHVLVTAALIGGGVLLIRWGARILVAQRELEEEEALADAAEGVGRHDSSGQKVRQTIHGREVLGHVRTMEEILDEYEPF